MDILSLKAFSDFCCDLEIGQFVHGFIGKMRFSVLFVQDISAARRPQQFNLSAAVSKIL
jgi:hypothetical protein